MKKIFLILLGITLTGNFAFTMDSKDSKKTKKRKHNSLIAGANNSTSDSTSSSLADASSSDSKKKAKFDAQVSSSSGMEISDQSQPNVQLSSENSTTTQNNSSSSNSSNLKQDDISDKYNDLVQTLRYIKMDAKSNKTIIYNQQSQVDRIRKKDVGYLFDLIANGNVDMESLNYLEKLLRKGTANTVKRLLIAKNRKKLENILPHEVDYSTIDYQDIDHDDVCDIDFNSDSKYLLTKSGNNLIKIWQIEDNKLIIHKEQNFALNDDDIITARFNSKENDISKITNSSIEQFLKLNSLSLDKNFCKMSSNDLRLLAHRDEKEAFILDNTNEQRMKIECKKNADFFTGNFSPDGSHLALLSHERVDASEEMDYLQIVNTKTNKLLLDSLELKNLYSCISFSPDNKLLALGYLEELKVDLFDIETKQIIKTISEENDENEGNCYSVEFSPCGRYLLYTSSSEKGYIYHINTNKKIKTIDSEGRIYAKFNSNGKNIAIMYLDEAFTKLANVYDKWSMPKLNFAQLCFLTKLANKNIDINANISIYNTFSYLTKQKIRRFLMHSTTSTKILPVLSNIVSDYLKYDEEIA